MVYLDNNATTRIAPEVFEEMAPFLTNWYGNPSNVYAFGLQVRQKIEEARQRTAELIGAEPEEIIFTGCGTESNNTALMSALKTFPGKKHIITTTVEHPSVYNFCARLAAEGYRTTAIPVDQEGALDMDRLSAAVAEDTAVVSIMYANNESGVIFPLAEISRIIKGVKGVLFHTDAVQAAGKIPIDVKTLPVDMLSLSGHKLHAPKGVGALYVRKGTPFHPLLIGGHQEGGRRAGTENAASIIGLGKASEMARTGMAKEALFIAQLRDALEAGLAASCPGARINGAGSARLSNTSHISFPFIDGEAVLTMLDRESIFVSTGSACNATTDEPSRVLKAMRVPDSHIRGSMRFSLSRYTTTAHIDRLIETLPPIVRRLQELSPFRTWQEK